MCDIDENIGFVGDTGRVTFFLNILTISYLKVD